MQGRKQHQLPPITFFESITLEQQITQRAFVLRQLLRVDECQLSKKGYDRLVNNLAPIFNHVLAAETVLAYMKMYDVNYSNKHHMTILHLLVMFAPDLAELVITNSKFHHINFKCKVDNSKMSASALDLAVDHWFEGRCSYQVIALLLKHGATVMDDAHFILPNHYLLNDICESVLFNPRSTRTVEDVVRLLVLLGRYGFAVKEEFEAFKARRYADKNFLAQINDQANCTKAHQDYLIDSVENSVLKQLAFSEEAELLVELTAARLVTAPSWRRYNERKSIQGTFFDPPPVESVNLSDVLYGVGNRL